MLRPRYQYPTRWYPSREQGSGNGCLSGEENTDLEQEVSGTLSKGDHSHPGEQDFCVPAITIQGGPAMSVFVVGLNGCRLMPTSERKARLLLKHGKASVYRKVPFTIKLNYKTGSTTQSGYLGIDTGSQHIGVSVVREDGTVLHKEEIGLRDSMSKRKLMQSRASSRRGRRHRKTRYRHPKWRPKAKRVYCEIPDRKGRHWKKKEITFASKRAKGWLPPSLQSKTDHHIWWIKKLQDLLPEGYRLSIELGRFDPARLKDPEIHGELYQKVCNVVYQSTNGRMDAEIESNTLYVTPKKFSKDELTNIKKSVWKQIQDKVFINGKYADKQEYGIKDYKGQTVISNYMYFDKKLKTNAYIHGKTFVKPGKYDSLYPDAEYYVKDANTKMGLKLKLLNYAVKTYRSNDYLVLVYFAESLLIAIVLALVAYIHVCENGKKESDCAKNDENIC